MIANSLQTSAYRRPKGNNSPTQVFVISVESTFVEILTRIPAGPRPQKIKVQIFILKHSEMSWDVDVHLALCRFLASLSTSLPGIWLGLEQF